MTLIPPRTSGRVSPRRFAITPALIHRFFWSRAITIRLHPSPCGRRVIRFVRNFRHGCMLSIAMISPMNLRLVQSSMRGRAGPRPERMT